MKGIEQPSFLSMSGLGFLRAKDEAGMTRDSLAVPRPGDKSSLSIRTM